MAGNAPAEQSPGPKADITDVPTISHTEDSQEHSKWTAKVADGDTAMTLFDDPDELHEEIDPVEARKILWKIDFMILPYLAVCYAFFYIDKTTLSYAAIFGIRDDLHLHGTQYNWLSSIFYFGFLAWAFPTNFLMQRLPIGKFSYKILFDVRLIVYFKVNTWGRTSSCGKSFPCILVSVGICLPFIVCKRGVFLMIQAACNSFETLAVLRALGGAAEACSDPAFMLITSMWYTRREQPVRIGLWYTANGLGIALGGLLGYGIGHIRGALPSWKYEFIVM